MQERTGGPVGLAISSNASRWLCLAPGHGDLNKSWRGAVLNERWFIGPRWVLLCQGPMFRMISWRHQRWQSHTIRGWGTILSRTGKGLSMATRLWRRIRPVAGLNICSFKTRGSSRVKDCCCLAWLSRWEKRRNTRVASLVGPRWCMKNRRRMRIAGFYPGRLAD